MTARKTILTILMAALLATPALGPEAAAETPEDRGRAIAEEADPEPDMLDMSIEALLDLDVTTASKKKEALTAPL